MWVVVGVVAGGAVAIDPWGVQAFLVARLLVVTVAITLGSFAVVGSIRLPSARWPLVAAGGLLTTLFVSSLLSGMPLVSLLGASGRQMGWLAWVVFAVAFLVGASLFRPGGNGPEVALVVSAAGALLWVAFVGILEAVGHPLADPSQAFGDRLQSTFGNPAVLGAYLSLAMPIVASGLSIRRLRILTVPALAVGVWMLVASGTRGAWIALASVGMVSIGLAWRRPDRSGRRVAVALVAGLLSLAAVSTLATGRWTTTRSGVEGRMATWAVAVRVIANDPVVGVGLEGFREAFAEHVDDSYVIEYTRDQPLDRAHSGLLDLTASGGLLGLGFYAVVLAGVGGLAITAVRRGDALSLGMAAGGAAYLIQQQALFQLAVLDVVLWFVAGLLATRLGVTEPIEGRVRKAVAAGMIVVAVTAAAYAAAGLVADRMDDAAIGAPTAAVALDLFGKAAAIRPVDSIHVSLAVAGMRGIPEANLIGRQIEMVDDSLRWAPNDGVLLLTRAGLLVDLFEATGDVAPLSEAMDLLLRLIDRDPTNGAAHLRIGAIAFHLGDHDGAELHWLEAARLMPHRPEPAQNLLVLRSG